MTKTPCRAAILLPCVVLALFVPRHKAPAQDKAAKIHEVLSLAHSYGQFNGAVLVAENGKVIYRNAFGLANMEWGIPNTTETRFRIGSITKQFTAALALQLVEQGKLKLDAKLSEYLPDYRQEIGKKVTIHHLLTHTSGIPSYTSRPDFEREARNQYKVDEFVKAYASGDLEFEPGTKFTYSNSGFFLLGAVIERVTGKSYEEVLKENILDPVGMKNTGYDRHDRILTKRAAGYSKTLGGYTNAPYLDMSVPYAAGSMYSTIDDLYLWDQALHSDKVISPRSKALMFTPFLDNFAYGWMVTEAPFRLGKEPVKVITHGGTINGFGSMIVRFPAQKNLIVMIDNTSQDQHVDLLSVTVGNILYNQPYQRPKISIAEVLLKTIEERGVEAGIEQYRDLKATQPTTYNFDEQELNTLGYRLLRTGKVPDAVAIFRLNVEAYPEAFNPYDSLGEAYMAMGDRVLAARNYRKSLDLNPDNTNAAEALKQLEKMPR